MKKLGTIIILSLLLVNILVLTTQQIKADIINTNPENPNEVEVLGINPANLPENPDDLKDQSATYLKQELMKVIPVIGKINPFLKAVTGYEFNLSFEFGLALIISLILWVAASTGINLFYKNPPVSLLIGFLLTIIANNGGLNKEIVPKIAELINDPKTGWFFLGIGIFTIILINLLGKYYKKIERERAIENLGKSEKDLKKSSQNLSGIVEGMKDIKKGADSYKPGK